MLPPYVYHETLWLSRYLPRDSGHVLAPFLVGAYEAVVQGYRVTAKRPGEGRAGALGEFRTAWFDLPGHGVEGVVEQDTLVAATLISAIKPACPELLLPLDLVRQILSPGLGSVHVL
jgi:hypothetical protein